MQASLALTAVLMGLAGGPHCIAMCGAACAGIGQAAGERRGAALALFQLGRVVGYALLGALAAASMQGLGWLTVHSAALRPVWTMVHVAAAVIGLVLLIQARQPLWLETGARRIWARVRGATQRWGLAAPLGIGVATSSAEYSRPQGSRAQATPMPSGAARPQRWVAPRTLAQMRRAPVSSHSGWRA